jgi:amino-acid N-acetyltransferase
VTTASMTQPLTVIASSPLPSTVLETETSVRAAEAADAPAIHALITEYLSEGHLLPRSLEEIRAHVHRFLVATHDGRVVGCGELAPLGNTISEIRSLVVNRDIRGLGLGTDIIQRLVQRATSYGFEKLCAFTHRPSYFVRQGFSIVPHVWLPEKIVTDCHSCPHFRRCGQYAVVRALGQRRARHG